MSMKQEGGLFIYDNQHEAQQARMKAWGADKLSASFFANELFGEGGEFANVIKKLARAQMGVPGSRATTDALADELADVMISLRNLAIKLDIEIEDDLILPHTIFSIDDINEPSDWGRLVGAWVGKVCHLPPIKNLMMIIRMRELRIILHQVAKAFNIDLAHAVQTKWNETSLKNGFPHRVQLSYTLEETFK